MSKPVTIERIVATPVNIAQSEATIGPRGRRHGYSRTIVEVQADNGLVGFGEAPGATAADIINHRFATHLVGQCVAEIEVMRRMCTPKTKDYGTVARPQDAIAFSAIDIALWDLAGKDAGLPLYRLLGGACREKAPFVSYAYMIDVDGLGCTTGDVPALMARRAGEYVEAMGTSVFEFKVGRYGVECDIATVQAVRETLGPGIDIAVDANMVLTEPDARHLLAAVSDVRLENFEEPVESFGQMERLRRDFDVPMSTHCTELTTVSAYPWIDSVVGDINIAGGMLPTITEAAVVRSHGRNYWLRSARELGIAWAAMCHLGMVCRNFTRPSQSLIHVIEDDLIVGAPWLVRDGGVRPPDRPGLGVELDRDALEHFAEKFSLEGDASNYVDAV